MAKKVPQSAPKPGETKDMDKYEPFDAEWRKIGLSAPARRALVDAKLYKVSDLRKITSAELDQLHGMGKSSIARIKVIMHGKKIQFRL
jgi:DNA-directed RNA polymerase alpha subunit